MNSIFLFLACAVTTAPTVSVETVKAVAVKEAELEWRSSSLGTVIPYYDFNGAIAAYACVFSLHPGPFPDNGTILDSVKLGRALKIQAAAIGDTALVHAGEDLTWGVNRYGTVIVAARTDQVPILETANCLPRFFTNLDQARAKARDRLGERACFTHVYYRAPEDEWFGFTDGRTEILINSYSLAVCDRTRLQSEAEPVSTIPTALARRLSQSWDQITRTPKIYRLASAHIDSVPFCLWSYGCSPTASAMIMWYWDNHGYGRLVDYFFDRWDAVENSVIHNIPNVQQELAIAMGTDSMTGATYSKYTIASAHVYVAGNINGYSFTSRPSADGNQSNGWVWNFITAEIDAGRPCSWSVFHYFPEDPGEGHSLCAVGYLVNSSGDSLVTVHNTWDTAEHNWALWVMVQGSPSTDFVVNVTPGGKNDNNIFLTFPQSTSNLITGLKYAIQWQNVGSAINKVDISYATGPTPSSWHTIASAAANTDSYVWTVPQESTQARVNITGYAGANVVAADGSVKQFTIRNLAHTGDLSLFGHIITYALGVAASPTYLFTTKATMGIEAFDISNPAVPKDVGGLILSGYTQNLLVHPPYLYAACQTGGFRIVDISNIKKLTEIGNYTNKDRIDGVAVVGSLAFIAGEQTGLTILDVSDPKNPKVKGTLPAAAPGYAVAADSHRCYVAGPQSGVAVIDVSDPTHPVVASQLKTDGLPTAVALNDGYLYAAMGTVGIDIIDLANPTTKTVLKTNGIATSIALADRFLYVANGATGTQAFDISDPMTPKEIGSVHSFSNSSGVAAFNQYYFIADGNPGVYIIKNQDAVAENGRPVGTVPRLQAVSPNPFSRNTAFRFSLPAASRVSISVYDPLGRQVAIISASGTMAAGAHTTVWDGTDTAGRKVAPGVYFYRFLAGTFSQTGKIVLVR